MSKISTADGESIHRKVYTMDQNIRIRLSWVIAITIFVIVSGLSFFGYLPNANDAYLNRFSKQLTELPVPPDCLSKEQFTVLGKLNGNGNGTYAHIIQKQNEL
jgi:hypothetical protein